MQVLMRSVDKEKLPLALKGASEKLRDMFFKSLSERAGKMLQEDMAALGQVKLRDVDEAQGSIVLAAKEMLQNGEIELSGSKDEELIY
jgi:flagellar motor switch protein FliG